MLASSKNFRGRDSNVAQTRLAPDLGRPVKIVLAAIGVGLQDALPSGEIPVRVGHSTVARELEQRGRWAIAVKGAIAPNTGVQLELELELEFPRFDGRLWA